MGLFSSSSSKTTSQSYLPVQAEWMKKIIPQYGAEVGQGQPVYAGERVAALTPEQQEAINVGGWSQYLTPGNIPMYGQTGAALADILGGEMGAEPYSQEAIDTLFRSAYEQPARRQWSEFIQPTIREAYSGPGFWGTSRMEAEKQGAQDLSNWLGEQYGSLRWGAEEANRALAEAKAGRALAAIPTGISYGQAPTQQALAMLAGRETMAGVAGTEQQQQQAQINANIQKFAEQNRLTDPEDMEVLLALLGMGYSSATSKTTGAGLGSSLLGGLFGGFGQGFGSAAGAGMF